MPGRIVHVAQDLRGALAHWDDRRWRGIVTEADRILTPAEVKDRFLDLLADGVRYLPIGEPCPGFDLATGCPGHDQADPEPAIDPAAGPDLS